jgi:tetratricopeptide (TPR) repeat protein
MEKYFENHKHLCWSTSAKETLALVKYYLKHDKDRQRIAGEGQMYAYENLNYETMLLGIINDVLNQKEVRNSSRWYDRCDPIKDLYHAGNYKEVVERVTPLVHTAGSQRLKDELLFCQANAFYFLGHYEQSAQVFTGLIERKQQVEWIHNLGVTLYKMGNAAAGERRIQQALEMRPEYLDAKFNLEFARLNAPYLIELKLTRSHFRS